MTMIFVRRYLQRNIILIVLTVSLFVVLSLHANRDLQKYSKRNTKTLSVSGISLVYTSEIYRKRNLVAANGTGNEWKSASPEISPNFPLNNKNPFLLWSDKICKGIEDLALIILIHSAPTHFVPRMVIRETWGNVKAFNYLHFRRVFLFGRVNSQELQEELEIEHRLYGDLLQSNFVDSYHNLSLNSLYGIRWVNENCSEAKVVMKVDDDVVVDIDAVISRVVSKYIVSSHRVYCNLLTDSPILRNNDSKYYVHPNQFKEQSVFPPYCEGKAVIFTSDLVKPMLQESYFTPVFWLEDVYMYGLVLGKISNIKIDRYGFTKEFELDARRLIIDSKCQKMFTEVSRKRPEDMNTVWKLYRLRGCVINILMYMFIH